jgi:hypothetical protein
MAGRLYLVLFAIIAGSISSFAQCDHTITLTTQAQVDAFPSTHGCSVLQSNFVILGYPTGDITNLDSLYMIEEINGYFSINGNVWLTDISGLSNLRRIGGNFTISTNSRLHNLDGLENLESALSVEFFSGELRNISGLIGLRSTGRMSISQQPHLTSLDGLQNLATITRLDIGNNPKLNDISALSGPRTIEGFLGIGGNPLLTSLAALEQTSFLQYASVSISYSQFTSLDGLNLDTLSTVSIRENPKLADVSALSSLRKVSSLNIDGNPMLTTLTDFPHLEYADRLLIVNNQSLNNLGTFPALHTVTTRLQIHANQTLASLQGLNSLTTVGGQVWILHNPGLNDLSGLESLQSAAWLYLYHNINLTSLNGLDAFQTTGGTVTPGPGERNGIELTGNFALRDISALHQITAVNGDLVITEADSLRNLAGLEGIDTVTGMIFIDGNNTLQTLEALSDVSTIGYSRMTYYEETRPYSFIAANNAALTDLGIRSLRSMPASLLVRANANLRNVNDLGSLEEVGSTTISPVEVTISDNPLLGNLDSLSSLTMIRAQGTPQLNVQNNEVLDRFCGLYEVIENTWGNLDITISNNGAETTPEQIVADGPCSGETSSHPTNMVFADLTPSSLTVSFTPGSAQPSGGYLLLMRANSSPYPTRIPVDGQTYNVGNLIGSSTIVVGKSTTPTDFYIVGLSSSTTYHFALFTYGSDLDYDTENPLLGQATTLEEPIAQPTDIVFSEVTGNSMTVSFTPSTSPGVDGYITLMRADNPVQPNRAPADGTAYSVGNLIGSSTIVVGVGMATELHIVQLQPETHYYFHIYSYTNDGSYNYQTERPLSWSQETSEAPAAMAMAYPNPFNESVTIRFTAQQDNTPVRVMIFDKMGTPVAELLNAEVAQGEHEVKWDGTDSNGNKVGGMFYYNIVGQGKTERGRIMSER